MGALTDYLDNLDNEGDVKRYRVKIGFLYAVVVLLLISIFLIVNHYDAQKESYCADMGGKLYGRNGKIQCIIETDLSLCRMQSGGIYSEKLPNLSWKD